MRSFDMNEVNKLAVERLLQVQSHPTLPIKIYKYSQECVFNRAWTEITLRSRGLVLDSQGNWLNNPMPKFFNAEEVLNEIPTGMPYTVWEKADGSCVEVFRYNGELIVCTLGSFASEQALIAKEMLRTQYANDLNLFQEGMTYIFELLVPENRIVLNYGSVRELRLLCIRSNANDYDSIPVSFGSFPVVKQFHLDLPTLMTERKRADFLNMEGYVVKFENGMRIKIKYDEYFRLHKIMTGVNERFVWEAMKDGVEIPLDNVPDEFFKYITTVKEDLTAKFQAEDMRIRVVYNSIETGITRKEFAARVLPFHKEIAGVLFAILDNKRYDYMIWEMLKPEVTEAKFNSMKKIVE